MTKPLQGSNTPFAPETYMQDLRCPLCHCKVLRSDYLMELFDKNPHARWLAHLVTHYRHHHISWWDNCWGRYGHSYRGDWFGAYEEEKAKVNESSKRQIIRKGHLILLANGIQPEYFKSLQNTTEATMKVANKFLEPRRINDSHIILIQSTNRRTGIYVKNSTKNEKNGNIAFDERF